MNIFKKFFRYRLSKRLYAIFILLVLLPLTAVMAYLYSSFHKMVEYEVTNSIYQTLTQIQLNIDNKFKGLLNIANMVITSPNLYNYLIHKDSGDSDTLLQHYNDVKVLRLELENRKTIDNIYNFRIYIEGKEIYESDKDLFAHLREFESLGWYEDVLAAGGMPFWKKTHSRQISYNHKENVVSCARLVRDPRNWNLIRGVLLADIPERILFDNLAKFEKFDKSNIFIVDESSEIVSCLDKSLIGTTLTLPGAHELDPYSPITGYHSWDNSFYTIVKKIDITNWYIVAILPSSELYSGSTIFNRLLNTMIATVILILLFVAFLLMLVLLTEWLSRRIETITDTIKLEGVTGYEQELNSGSKKGIYQLEKSVGILVSTVKQLLDESYGAKIKEKDLQLKALQAQVNPHFLYNTLDAVKWAAMDSNYAVTVSMLSDLSKYFRLSLHKGKDIVTIKDEIELTKAYVDIQRKRFADSFQFLTSCDDSLLACLIPKLTLQPIVENAFAHGIQKKKGRTGTIRLKCEMRAGDIYLTVSDDGVGMDAEQIAAVLECNDERHPEGSYGIYHVNEKIKLCYGEGYGVKIISEPGKGTDVVIKLNALLR